MILNTLVGRRAKWSDDNNGEEGEIVAVGDDFDLLFLTDSGKLHFVSNVNQIKVMPAPPPKPKPMYKDVLL